MNSKSLLGISLLLGASFIWGVAYIPTRYLGSNNVSVFLELLIRYSFPFVIFGIIYFQKFFKTPFSIIKNCLITGSVLFFAIICSIYGLRMVQYGSIGLLVLSLNVIFVPLYFVIHYKQKLSKNLIIGIILSFTGTIILTIGTANTPLNIGVIICLLAGIGYTAYIILCSKILPADLNPGIVQFYQSIPFIILCIPIVLFQSHSSGTTINWSNPTLIQAILFIGLGAGTIGYQLFFYGQRISHPIVTTLVLASQTIFSTIADVFLFKIELSILQIIAYICIIAAVFIAPLQAKKAN